MSVTSTRSLATLATAALATATLIPSAASAQTPVIDSPVVSTATYACDNGIDIDVNNVLVDGLSAVAVSFPDGRSPDGVARQLLPRSQSGSGMRYASDIATFHLKSGEVFFEAAASHLSEAVARTQCEMLGRRFSEALTQYARAGSYRYLSPLQSNDPTLPEARRVAENICFASDGSAAFVLAPFFQGRRARLVHLSGSGRSAILTDVGPVDAGVGQRRYDLSDPQTGNALGTLHYTARGAVESDALNAAARFSSITLDGERSDCMGLENALYTALTQSGIVQISFKEGAIEARVIRPSGQESTMTGGYLRVVGEVRQYWFFDGETRLKVDVSAGVARDTSIVLDDWTSRPLAPLAHFSVSPMARSGGGVPSLDSDTAELIEDLMLCNHIAGEASGTSQRDVQLSVIAGEVGCDTVPTRYAQALRESEGESKLREFLIARQPNWVPPA